MAGGKEKLSSKAAVGSDPPNSRGGKEKISSKSPVGNDPPNLITRPMSEHMRQKTMRSKGPSKRHSPRVRSLYILVMGLTGAGKSTFISTVTENPGILIGEAEDLEGVTQEVQDYLLYYQHKGVPYRIHLIDSPGFDDGNVLDSENLNKIATYININHRLKKRLAGVLYLHDITKGKVGGVGVKNLRMLEGMIGQQKYNNCTFVTTKWGCSNLQDEEKREQKLKTSKQFFGTMLDYSTHADMRRFDPKSKGTALDIIKRYLDNDFTTQLSEQMLGGHGPRLALGDTDAGKVIMEDVKKLEEANLMLGKVSHAKNVLAQEFDEALFQEFVAKRRKLKQRIGLQRSGRWVVRMTIVGGAIAATVLTFGPGAAVFALEPAFERAVIGQRRNEKQAKEDLKQELQKRAAGGHKLKEADGNWLWDSKVKTLRDVEETYSVTSRSGSAEKILGVVRQGAVVGIATTDTTTNELIAGEFDYGDTDSEDSDFADDKY